MIYGRRGRRALEVLDNPNATAKERIAPRKSNKTWAPWNQRARIPHNIGTQAFLDLSIRTLNPIGEH